MAAVLPDVRYRQRVQKRLTRLRKRLLAFVINANPECFDHGGRLAPGCFPARIPPEAANLHGLMRIAECKLAMIRCFAGSCKVRSAETFTLLLVASRTPSRNAITPPKTSIDRFVRPYPLSEPWANLKSPCCPVASIRMLKGRLDAQVAQANGATLSSLAMLQAQRPTRRA
jgi:hypothetical protein